MSYVLDQSCFRMTCISSLSLSIEPLRAFGIRGTHMAKVAVLGLGAMGSRLARNLLISGHAVTVWNRTVARAAPLVAGGASIAGTPREAATGADFVIAMVRDEEASRAVWLDPVGGAVRGLAKGAVAIESSTLTPSWLRELGGHVAGAGASLLDAPVAGSRPQAEAGHLIHFVGGDAATLATAMPVLSAIGGAVHHVGKVGDGAAVKLAVNALLGIQVAAMAEMIGSLARAGLDIGNAIDVIAATPVCSPAAKGAAASMLARAFAPLFPVELVEKDFGYALAQADALGAAVPMTRSAHAIFADALGAGFGPDHLTRIVDFYR